MQTQEKSRIRVGRTEMDFTHEGKTLTAVHPFYGPANSKTLQDSITQSGLVVPIFRQATSFVHEYFKGSESQAQELTGLMRIDFLKGFTGIFYDNKTQTAYFIDNPNFDSSSIVDAKDLSERVNESYAQVPFTDIKGGLINDWRDVSKNKYVTALAGEEGAEKLSEIASKHSNQEAYIWVPNTSKLTQPEARVASLYSDRYGSWLLVYGGDLGDDRDCSFGVLTPSEKAE